ncbi:MAG TPA: hypothetical protein VNJ70_17805 [Thermoanaerobaculia bacterium]|nr:hypothetical protein [Thermoanaerobaculia bacterium]
MTEPRKPYRLLALAALFSVLAPAAIANAQARIPPPLRNLLRTSVLGTPTDEECATWESSSGKLEFQPCGPAALTRVRTLDCTPGVGDFSDFSDAMTAMAAIPAGVQRGLNTQWVIFASPCRYQETGAVTIPEWVTVTCRGSTRSSDRTGDEQPCIISGGHTGDYLRLGSSNLVGFLVDATGMGCSSECGAVASAPGGGHVSLTNVTVETNDANVAAIRFVNTFGDRLNLDYVTVIAEAGVGTTKGLVFSSSGPGYVRGGTFTTNSNTGGTAIEKAGNGDLFVQATFIEQWWTTQATVTGGTGDLVLDAVDDTGAHIETSRATAPACNRIGKRYTDSTAPGALCWCNGTAWEVAAGSGTCA